MKLCVYNSLFNCRYTSVCIKNGAEPKSDPEVFSIYDLLCF